ncbi:MAG: hypothetical protein K0U41_06385 [Gammaproteobacteria bacterium]|nr:hypothetical protein [Gammaproteobacteria bacterium]
MDKGTYAIEFFKLMEAYNNNKITLEKAAKDLVYNCSLKPKEPYCDIPRKFYRTDPEFREIAKEIFQAGLTNPKLWCLYHHANRPYPPEWKENTP